MSRPILFPSGEGAHRRLAVDGDTFSVSINSKHPVIPLHPDILTNEYMRHRVVATNNLGMSIGVDGTGTDFKQAEATGRQRLEGRFFHFKKMGVDLLSGGAVDT
jgi:hypothetical protein